MRGIESIIDVDEICEVYNKDLQELVDFAYQEISGCSQPIFDVSVTFLPANEYSRFFSQVHHVERGRACITYHGKDEHFQIMVKHQPLVSSVETITGIMYYCKHWEKNPIVRKAVGRVVGQWAVKVLDESEDYRFSGELQLQQPILGNDESYSFELHKKAYVIAKRALEKYDGDHEKALRLLQKSKMLK